MSEKATCFGCDQEEVYGEGQILDYSFENGATISLCRTCAFRLGQQMARRLLEAKGFDYA